jgi:hypothetical protein
MDEKKTILILIGAMFLIVGFLAMFENAKLTGKPIDDLNTGTINLNYNGSSKMLKVWGQAPVFTENSDPSADLARVIITNLSGSIFKDINTSVITFGDDNKKEYNFTNINISGWPLVHYDVIVKFYNEVDPPGPTPAYYDYMPDYDVGMIFSGLVTGAAANVDDLTARVIALEGNVSALNSTVIIQGQNITQLFEITELLQNETDDLNSSIISLQADVATLEEDVDDLTGRLNGLTARLLNTQSVISSMQEWLVLLDNRVEEMNHGTLNMYYLGNQNLFLNNLLYVWGESPQGAECAKVELVNTAGDVVASKEDDRMTPPRPRFYYGDNDQVYYVTFDTDDLDPIKYNVVVKFYTDDDCEDWMGQSYDVGGFFDNLALEELMYGFSNIVFTSRVETYYAPNVTVPITYSLKSDTSTWFFPAKIWLRGSNGFNRLLRTQDIDADKGYRFTDSVTFNETGTYDLRLQAEKKILFWTVVFESINFTTDVVDLADSVPDSSVEIVDPDENSNELSSEPNVSWNKPGLINMRALVGANTPAADESCDVYYYSNEHSTLGRLYLSGLSLIQEDDTKICTDDILSTMMDNGNEGVYDVEVEEEFVGSSKQKDTIKIGIDGTAPVIDSIVPEVGYYSGVIRVIVTAHDELSGIKSVWVTLINKETTEPFSAEAIDNNGTSWWVDFDTIARNMSDGDYYVSVNVTDVAGNSREKTVDPSVDNTPPELDGVTVPSDMCIGKQSIIKMTITDMLAGVNHSSVIAVLTLPNGTNVSWTPPTYTGQSTYNAAFTPSVDLNGTNTYTLTIDAQDKASPSNNMTTNVTEHNITVTNCPAPPSTGGGGGGSHDSGGVRCTSSMWTCGSWTDCINGAQTRSCSKSRNCFNGYEPETRQTCTVSAPPEEQRPAEVVAQPPAENITLPVEEQKPAEKEPTIWEKIMQMFGGNVTPLLLLALLLLVIAAFYAKYQNEQKAKELIKKYAGKKKHK